MWLLAVVLLCAIGSTSSAPNTTGVLDGKELPAEARLIKNLLDRYKYVGKLARPVHDFNQSMNVSFGMRLIYMDINEQDQMLKTSVWARMLWTDEYLVWNPDEYDGLKKINLPSDLVWCPDISLMNTAETKLMQRDADLMIYHTGDVLWVPQRSFNSACLIDTTNYPYDEHTCDMWFQSMSVYSDYLDLYPNDHVPPWDMDTYLSSFEESQEWEVKNYSCERVRMPAEVGMKALKFSKRVSLKFSLTIKRRLGYIGHVLMLPCVFLGCLGLVVFALSPQRPDRNVLAMALYTSFMVLLLALLKLAPPTAAAVPKLSVYYLFNVTLVMLIVFLSSTVIYVSHLGDYNIQVPKLVKIIFIDILARILFMHDRVSDSFPDTPPRREHPHNEEEQEEYPDLSSSRSLNDSRLNEQNVGYRHLEKKLERLEGLLRKMIASSDQQPIRAKLALQQQWRKIAAVMDRLWFVLYLVAIILSLIVIFPKP